LFRESLGYLTERILNFYRLTRPYCKHLKSPVYSRLEAFRDDNGKAKHGTLVTLGRLDQLTESLDSVISGLLKVTGRPDFLNAPLPAAEFESAPAFGNVWALNEPLR